MLRSLVGSEMCIRDSVYSYGQNHDGQLGTGNFNAADAPKLIETLASHTTLQISAGRGHSAATVQVGGRRQLWTWGLNVCGQLGREVVQVECAASGESAPAPVAGNRFKCCYPAATSEECVSSLRLEAIEPVMISAGEDHTAAVDTQGAVWAWGGEINKESPHKIWESNQGTPRQIVAGSLNTLVLCDDGVHTVMRSMVPKAGGDTDKPESPMAFENSEHADQAVSVQFCEASMFDVLVLGSSGQLYMVRCDTLDRTCSVYPKDTCLLYTSDAADEEDSVDLGGRRIIKKKKNKKIR
eukprot:TRINITY_DN7534_c0_g1_i2.p1 TRINITY_DN7534_c0_g1~~TRINITY_DN7534_c0_g1_i2.p1  ORF type:complete len:297 (+),score=74.65 TRINITY_DN7534_c0_g1_i2:87-977(+)